MCDTVTISVGSDMVACNPHQSRFKMFSSQSLQVCWLHVVDYMWMIQRDDTNPQQQREKTDNKMCFRTKHFESNRTCDFIFQQFL